MAVTSAPSARTPTPEELQASALSLWTFVHLKVPRFTFQLALDVVTRLLSDAEGDLKALAKQLRVELRAHGISLKHTAALDAAARLLGHRDWHTANRTSPKVTLTLTVMANTPEESFADWHELTPRLCAWVDAFQKAKAAKVIEARFGEDYVFFAVPIPKKDGHPEETEMLPILAINPTNKAKNWLDGASTALETLRRHVEEAGTAVLDGLAVLQLCTPHRNLSSAAAGAMPPSISCLDVCNSELVLLREDDELTPGQGFEIARGDEMTCWSQLELAHKGRSLEITLDDGAWRIGEGRYVWQMATLRSQDYTPGTVLTALSEADSEKLLRRYRRAKAILGGRVKHHEVTKRIQYLSGPTDTYRVDLRQVFKVLDDAGHDWDSFCAAERLEQPKVPDVQVGFVMTIAERLRPADPNKLFAAPPRAQLVLARDDSLLRSLIPRVDFVRYRLPRDIDPELGAQVRTTIQDFGDALRFQKLTAAGQFQDPDDPLPYLVYASDAEELRLNLDSLGMEMHIGVMPHLFSTDGVLEKQPNVWSYAFGHALFLDIDFQEREQP